MRTFWCPECRRVIYGCLACHMSTEHNRRLADDLSKLPLRAGLKPRAFRIGTADANYKRGGFSA